MATNQQTAIVSPRIERLRNFVIALSTLVETAAGEPQILREGSRLLKELVAVDDWLPSRYAEASAKAISNIYFILIRGNAFPWSALSGGQARKPPSMTIPSGESSASCVARNPSSITPARATAALWNKAIRSGSKQAK